MQAVDQRGPAGGAGKNGRIGPYEKEYFEAWPLERAFPGKPYVNRGISGQTTSQLLLRLHEDVIDLGARAVVILAGTNDIAGNTGPSPLRRSRRTTRPWRRLLDLVYLDYFSAMVDEHGLMRRELADQGLHPNAAGYAVMAPLAAKAIAQTAR